MDGIAKVAPVGYVLALIAALLAVLSGVIVDRQGEGCEPDIGSGALAEEVRSEVLSAEQMAVAAQAVRAVRMFPATAQEPRAAVIVLATGFQESRLRNLDYGDRDSLGFLQQRPSQGWGTPAEVRDVGHATRTFLELLVQIPDWRTRRVTDVAADVQRPAEEYRGLYQQWVPAAVGLVTKLWMVSGATTTAVSDTDGTAARASESVGCGAYAQMSADASIVYPVPMSLAWSDRRNWGGHGANWRSWHTGTDFSLPCGTTVVAAHAGTVEIDSGQGWAGRWLVKVTKGRGQLTTWYAHMQSVAVEAGHHVRAGQQIGAIGAEGNATGCHLHFEVHKRGGSIYGSDNVDPSHWLKDRVE